MIAFTLRTKVSSAECTLNVKAKNRKENRKLIDILGTRMPATRAKFIRKLMQRIPAALILNYDLIKTAADWIYAERLAVTQFRPHRGYKL